MAMAAVRFAARRLIGLQQQAIIRPAVLNRGRSPALHRFTSSEACAASVPKLHPSVSEDTLLRTADQKKVELFEVLTAVQMNKNIPRTRRMKDRKLLQRLTSHVDSKASNPEWKYGVDVLAGISKFREQTVTAKGSVSFSQTLKNSLYR